MNATYLSEVTGHIHRADHSVLRERVMYWPARIATVHDLKAAIRAGARAFGACRPFFVTMDGAALCHRCTLANIAAVMDSVATKTNDGWCVNGCDMDSNVEDVSCDGCGDPIGYVNE